MFRTGLVVMFCQAVMSVQRREIIEEYFLSEKTWSSSADKSKAKKEAIPGKLDKQAFAGAPKDIMVQTLCFIESTYGSVNAYLDYIGFDREWRRRFVHAVATNEQKIMKSKL